MISKKSIEEVKEKANLIEVAAEFTSLRRQGGSYVGVCPFHAEKSGSFFIRDSGQFYHCFGCGASGNAISFVMQARGISFPDAIEELAQRFGVRLEYEGRADKVDDRDEKELLYRVNEYVAQLYQNNLKSAPPAVLDYLKQRGVTPQAIEAFRIGFATNDRDYVAQKLKKKELDDSTQAKSGLVRRSARGDVYDALRARIVFPILIERGRVAGFGGRLIPSLVPEETRNSAPKYLNSPETPVYQKSNVLFGLPQALDQIRRKKEVCIVEGYLDVVGLWQAGVQNVLASCGTAITEQHVRRLSGLCRRVILLFDGDAAGQNAAGKSFEVFLNSGIDAQVVFLPDGEDPDTFALKHGSETEKALSRLARAPLFDSFIQYLCTRSGIRDIKDLGAASKGKLADEIASFLVRVENGIERSELIERAAMKLMIESVALHHLIRERMEKGGAAEPLRIAASMSLATTSNKGIIEVADLPQIDRELLRAVMVLKSEVLSSVLIDGALCEELHPDTLSFVQELSAAISMGDEGVVRVRVKEVLDRFGGSWLALWKEAHRMNSEGGNDWNEVVNQCQIALKRRKLNQLISRITEEMASVTDEAEKARLVQQQVELRRKAAG